MRKQALWFALGALGCASLLFAEEAVTDWSERFSRWIAVRDADAPIRNAVHLRQELTITNLFGLQTQFYRVPANRRLLIEQVAVFCNFGQFSGARIDQIQVAALNGGVPARYPISRSSFDVGTQSLAGPLRLYADGESPVLVNLAFSAQTNAVCEITATGQLARLSE